MTVPNGDDAAKPQELVRKKQYGDPAGGCQGGPRRGTGNRSCGDGGATQASCP